MIYTYRTINSNKVQPKTRSKIIFKFHFIIYRDLNVTVFSKRFPAIIYIDEVQHDVHIDSSIWRRKITLVQNVCCRVLHCVCDRKWIYNCQQQIDPDIVLLFIIAMHDPTIYLIWPPRSTSNVYRYKYGYRLPLNIHSHKSPWLSRLERHSSKPEVVGSNPAVGKNFSFWNSRSLHVADTSNQSIQMKSTVAYT